MNAITIEGLDLERIARCAVATYERPGNERFHAVLVQGKFALSTSGHIVTVARLSREYGENIRIPEAILKGVRDTFSTRMDDDSGRWKLTPKRGKGGSVLCLDEETWSLSRPDGSTSTCAHVEMPEVKDAIAQVLAVVADGASGALSFPLRAQYDPAIACVVERITGNKWSLAAESSGSGAQPTIAFLTGNEVVCGLCAVQVTGSAKVTSPDMLRKILEK